MTTKVFWTSLIAGMLISASALAVPQYAIRISGPGGYLQTCMDNSACDLAPAVGQMNVLAGVNMPALPGFSFIVDTLFSNSPGGPSVSILDSGWQFASSGGSGNIQVEFSATGYTYPNAVPMSTLLSSLGGASGAGVTVSGQQYIDLNNALFGTSGITAVHGPFVGPGAFSSDSSTQFISDGEYSITSVLNVTMASGTTSSGNFQARVVPEPATLVLLGIGLLGIGGFILRRRSKAIKAQS